MSKIPLIVLAERIAKRNGLPRGWTPWMFTAVANGVLCTGAVCPPITRGVRKGEPNYRRADRSTMATVVVPKRKRA